MAGLVAALGVLVPPAPAAALVEEAGDFVAEVERLRDLAFGSGSGLYVAPNAGERDGFAILARSVLEGDLAAADILAPGLGYELVRFTDVGSGLVLLGLREELVAGAPTRGWGSYFLRPRAPVPVLIEVPHALFDTRSFEVGATVFRDSGALGYLMNGAHRDANGPGSADVAHLVTSVFQEVHGAWSGDAGERDAWQIHGFAIANHPTFPAGTDAVLSSGDGGVSPEVVALDAGLDGLGFLSHAFNTLAVDDPRNRVVNGPTPGSTFSGLGATTNVQGVDSRGRGASFLHVELERSVRFDAGLRGVAAQGIVAVIQAPEPGVGAAAVALAFVAGLGSAAGGRRSSGILAESAPRTTHGRKP